jgi:alpha-D-xyloside xylohydrolase
MPYRPPLVAFETFVADPVDLPSRPPGQAGLSALVRGELVSLDPAGMTIKGQTTDGSTLVAEISAAGEGIIRVRLAPDAETQGRVARAMRLVRPGRDPNSRVIAAEGVLRLTTGPLVAEVRLDSWRIRFLEQIKTLPEPSLKLLTEENAGEEDCSGRMRTLPFGRSTVDSAVVAYHESFTAAPDERFVGLGEKFTAFDKRGQRAVMWNYDAFGAESDRSYKTVPFYLSSRGYGVLVDSGMATEFDMGQSTHTCVQIVVPDDQLDYYVLAGPTPADILDRFNQLTGRPSLPPKWAFGTWISSGYFADSQAAVLERARTLRERGIPCDVLHLDCFWQVADHWSDLRWDSNAFPDPEAMFADLAAMGLKASLWINPYISHLSPVLKEAEDFVLRRPNGEVYVADVWHGSQPACGIIDFTNPAATEWFQGKLRTLLRQGAAVFKTDFAEGVPADAIAHNGMTGTDLHNIYSLLFNDAVAEVTREVTGHELVWARCSFLGGQRHSAQWSGDTNCTYSAMASTLRGGLSHGVSGIPFWSHDAGGFWGRPTPDLYARWAQFGALSPLVRFHGTTSRLPWDFPEPAERAATDAVRLRYRLMPYLYTAAVTSARTGLPMMRPLLVDHPDDPAAWHADLEFAIGTDLIVAPMTDPTGTRPVYLPEGEWVDWWTGAVLAGRTYHTVTARLEQIPLFVRRGAVIPVVEPVEALGDAPFGPITLLCFDTTAATTIVISDVNGDSTITVDGATYEITVDGPATVCGAVPGRPASSPTEKGN